MNNPLKYIDPSGHNSDDPNAYWVIITPVYDGDGNIVGYYLTNSMGMTGYSDSLEGLASYFADADYDVYYYDQKMYEEACEDRGVEPESVAPLVPIYFVSEGSGAANVLDILDAWGTSLYPVGIVIRYEPCLDYGGEEYLQTILKHECYHYYEQEAWGFWVGIWYLGYNVEYVFELIFYLDAHLAHDNCEAEKGAIEFSGEEPDKGTSPWWEPAWGFLKTVWGVIGFW